MKYQYELRQYIDGKWVTIALLTKKAAEKVSKSLKTHAMNTVTIVDYEEEEIVSFMFSISHGPINIIKVYEDAFKR